MTKTGHFDRENGTFQKKKKTNKKTAEVKKPSIAAQNSRKRNGL